MSGTPTHPRAVRVERSDRRHGSDVADDTGPKHDTRLFGIVATKRRAAVVLRRGPSKHVRLILWDLAKDTFSLGQWLSGRIYDERCGLSPDGTLFVYFAGKFGRQIATFTAISRPPYFTALALWPDGGTYGGGGFFESNRRVVLNYGRVDFELNGGSSIPADFEVVAVTGHRATTEAASRVEANRGWNIVRIGKEGPPSPNSRTRVTFTLPSVEVKPCPAHTHVLLERRCVGLFEVDGPSRAHEYRLVDLRQGSKRSRAPSVENLGRLDWADWDHEGTLLTSERGCLFRQSFRGRIDDIGPRRLSADFRDQRFGAIRSPAEAQRWP